MKIKKITAGKTYRKYNVKSRNCAWVAIDIIRHGGIKDSEKKKLGKKLYRRGKTRTLVPNSVVWDVASIFGTKVQNIK